MNVIGEFPLVAVLGGGAVVLLGIIIYQAIMMEGSGPDPFRERSSAQSAYMRDVRKNSIKKMWAYARGRIESES
jgi:hypothetical protein